MISCSASASATAEGPMISGGGGSCSKRSHHRVHRCDYDSSSSLLLSSSSPDHHHHHGSLADCSNATTVSSESSPLEVDAHNNSYGSTFSTAADRQQEQTTKHGHPHYYYQQQHQNHQREQQQQQSTILPYWLLLISSPFSSSIRLYYDDHKTKKKSESRTSPSSFYHLLDHHHHHRYHTSTTTSNSRYPYHNQYYDWPRGGGTAATSILGFNWKLLYTALFLVGLLAVYFQQQQQQSTNGMSNNRYKNYYDDLKIKPEATMEFDHNIYVPDDIDMDMDNAPEEDEYSSSLSEISSPTRPAAATTTTTTANPKNMLIAQLSLGELTDITSRPNRAYARQHVMDYVRYSSGGRGASGKSFQKQCFDKVLLLNTILDNNRQLSNQNLRGQENENDTNNNNNRINQQEQHDHDHPTMHNFFSGATTASSNNHKNNDDDNAFSLLLPTQRIEYDAVALLPPDSIITSMDSNIFDLLPPNKLVAIAGWSSSGDDSGVSEVLRSKTDIVFFNLKHPLAYDVAKVWLDWIEPTEISCGAGNDLTLLVDAISYVLKQEQQQQEAQKDSEKGNENSNNNDSIVSLLSSVIAPLQETTQGFVVSRRNTSTATATTSSGSNTMSKNHGDDDDGVLSVSGVPPENTIKGIAPDTPEPRARLLLTDLQGIRVQLQTTADSVCYRYYPRCEVL